MPSIRSQLPATIKQARQLSSTVEGLITHLESAGVAVHRTAQGWSFERSGFHFAGYQLGQAYTGKHIEAGLAVDGLSHEA